MKVHPTALKHGIESEDVTQAASWALWVENLDDDSGNELVIHAMRARPKMLELLD